jgi:pimeloyl-ACP methyl ester carboxylesterase
MRSLLSLAHLIGLSLGLGGGTATLALLLKAKNDHAFVPAHLAAARPVTRLIIVGLVLLILSGIGFMFAGYHLTPRLVVKLVLVGTILVLGPIIDNVIEPVFRELAPKPGESASPAWIRVQRRYLVVEAIATGLFYAIAVIWVR